MLRLTHGLAICLFSSGIAGCRDKSAEHLAPPASALAPAPPPPAQAVAFVVDSQSSKLSFSMDAPIERISGDAPGALSGELFVSAADLAKSSGLLRVDLDKLSLYQEKREDEKAAFSERKKNDLQNQHARTWLEIASDAPEEVRQSNRMAEFRVTRLEAASAPSVQALSGPERKLTATVVGDLRLHGRKAEKRAKVELSFGYAGDKPTSLRVRTLEPLSIGLEEFDVRPREAFGKLAQKTLGALGSKVAFAAPIELEFSARPRP
jgi:polyisoprenoid-binding protein YceI